MKIVLDCYRICLKVCQQMKLQNDLSNRNSSWFGYITHVSNRNNTSTEYRSILEIKWTSFATCFIVVGCYSLNYVKIFGYFGFSILISDFGQVEKFGRFKWMAYIKFKSNIVINKDNVRVTNFFHFRECLPFKMIFKYYDKLFNIISFCICNAITTTNINFKLYRLATWKTLQHFKLFIRFNETKSSLFDEIYFEWRTWKVTEIQV